VCEGETLTTLNKHSYAKPQFGLKWFYCTNCEKDLCKDKYTGEWKVASYDVDIPEEEDEEEEN
jgi:hypothetical protein